MIHAQKIAPHDSYYFLLHIGNIFMGKPEQASQK